MDSKGKQFFIELVTVFFLVILLSFLFPAIKGVFGLIPAIYLLVERKVRKRTFSEIGFRPKNTFSDILKNWYLIILVAIVSPVAVLLFAKYFVPGFLSHVLSRVPVFSLTQMIPLLLAIIIGTFLEEMVYRSLLQDRLAAFTSPVAAIGISSAIFALMHYAQGSFAVVGYDIFTIFLDSVIYGVIYHRTKNIFAAWLAHALADIFAVIAVLLIF